MGLLDDLKKQADNTKGSEVSQTAIMQSNIGATDSALVLAGKARAVLEGRYHVDFADIRALAHPVLRHRLVLNFHGRADGIDSDHVIDMLLAAVKEELK